MRPSGLHILRTRVVAALRGQLKDLEFVGSITPPSRIVLPEGLNNMLVPAGQLAVLTDQHNLPPREEQYHQTVRVGLDGSLLVGSTDIAAQRVPGSAGPMGAAQPTGLTLVPGTYATVGEALTAGCANIYVVADVTDHGPLTITAHTAITIMANVTWSLAWADVNDQTPMLTVPTDVRLVLTGEGVLNLNLLFLLSGEGSVSMIDLAILVTSPRCVLTMPETYLAMHIENVSIVGVAVLWVSSVCTIKQFHGPQVNIGSSTDGIGRSMSRVICDSLVGVGQVINNTSFVFGQISQLRCIHLYVFNYMIQVYDCQISFDIVLVNDVALLSTVFAAEYINIVNSSLLLAGMQTPQVRFNSDASIDRPTECALSDAAADSLGGDTARAILLSNTRVRNNLAIAGQVAGAACQLVNEITTTPCQIANSRPYTFS